MRKKNIFSIIHKIILAATMKVLSPHYFTPSCCEATHHANGRACNVAVLFSSQQFLWQPRK